MIVGVIPSKLSLPRTAVMTAVSSVVLATSSAMSTTVPTLTVITCVEVAPVLSVTRTVKLSGPL
ncbi:hypothetical protein HK414_02945 [Ramlibacter terrae]|uniref:Secreted protein n=1 Tax=Ramlibacter terrae TaxID=2732511 RepID=A0ABX6P0C3_9BURK|nr:hypothetical protein HK414_02945 [Ramlibacter terrae]